jgi:hypothetical protein
MYLDDVIRFALDDVFYIFEYDRIEAYEFKIVRDAELDMDNDFSQDYVERMEEELQQRKGGRPMRLVYDAAIPPVMLRLLMGALRMSDQDPLVIGGGRYHNMKDLMKFPGKRPDLSWPRAEVAPHPVLDKDPHRPALDVIRKQDVLITYPYQSFDHVVRLMREAAIDPKVADDQDDDVPGGAEQPDRERAGERGAQRQAGAGERGVAGAVRRAAQHRDCGPARCRGGDGDLRRAADEGAQQAAADRAGGVRYAGLRRATSTR